MSGIFGIVRRDGAPVDAAMAVMREAMADWGRGGFGEWSEGCAALAQARSLSMPESRFETLASYDQAAGFAFTAAGRVDNREALVVDLSLGDRAGALGDGDLVLAAYRRWGEQAPARLFGDWSLAAWHPTRRRLFLARDHLGYTSLHYYVDARTFAFASSHRALLALGLAPIELDELYLAQYLISWPAYHGQRAAYSRLRRLPPAHALTLTPERCEVRSYWRMEDQTELRLSRRSEYVGAFREVFDEAVRTRLRSSGPIGVMLSGGLDSGSVAVTAARMLGDQGARLRAFTSVPVAEATAHVERRLADELSLARATAATGNIDLQALSSQRVNPIEGIRRALELFGAPIHAAANMFWLLDLHAVAQETGCHVLLSGSMGNAGVSWYGSPLSQPLAYQLRRLGVERWARDSIKRWLPRQLRVRAARWRLDPEWYRASAIHPAFARRLDLAQRRLEDPETFPRHGLEQRLSILKPGRSLLGAVHAAIGAKFDLDVRDPTADVRVIAFVLSVPDRVFTDPKRGLDRWLIREAMRDRLPDRVRLNRLRGQQASDLVPRLRASAGEVEATLDELATGPAAAYLDVAHMQEVWQTIQREDTPDAYRKAVSVLTRGIMGGLHANALARGEHPGNHAAG
jgi:asparagine synthase (glutamine-hydrolysing)